MDIQDPQYKSADGSALRVWRDTAQNRFLSEREGRPVFDEVIYVEVISPGSRDSSPVFECVRNFAPEMAHPDPLFGQKYEEYKSFILDFVKDEENDVSLSGTPLVQWPEMTRSLIATLKAQGIYTVDALAALPDTKLIVVGPDGRTWREKAAAYIAYAKDSGYATGLAAQLEQMRIDYAASEDRAKTLAALVTELQTAAATPAPKPGKAAVETPPASSGII